MRKVHFILTQKLSEAWSIDAINVDSSMLSGIQEEWSSLGPSVKVNLLCTFLGLRNRADMTEALLAVVDLSLRDEDDWVRTTGQMLGPLLKDPPEMTTLQQNTDFLDTVSQLEKMLSSRREGPSWRPSYLSYLPVGSDEQPPEKCFLFSVRPELALKPLLASQVDVDTLLLSHAHDGRGGEQQQKLVKRGLDVPGGSLSSSMVSSAAQEKGRLRTTSSLMEKRQYQQKKTVKTLSTEQAQALSRQEMQPESQHAQRARARVGLDVPATNPNTQQNTSVTSTSAVASTTSASSTSSSTSSFDVPGSEPFSKRSKTDADVTSSNTQMSSISSSSASSNFDLDALASLEPTSAPSSTPIVFPISTLAPAGPAPVTTIPTPTPVIERPAPTPPPPVAAVPIVEEQPKPLLSSTHDSENADAAAGLTALGLLSAFAAPLPVASSGQSGPPKPTVVADSDFTYEVSKSNKLTPENRLLVEKIYSAGVRASDNPDPNQAIYLILMHEEVNGPLFVRYYLEVNFHAGKYRRIKKAGRKVAK